MIIDSKGNDSSLFHRIKNESTIFQPTLYSIRTLYFLSLARIDIRQNDSKKLEGKPIPVDSIESTRIAKFSDTLHNIVRWFREKIVTDWKKAPNLAHKLSTIWKTNLVWVPRDLIIWGSVTGNSFCDNLC